MADEGLLSALQEEWGDEKNLANQPLTIKSLTSQVQLWLKKPEVKLAHLPGHLEQMRAKVSEARQATEHDLQQQLEADLASLMRNSIQDYEDLGYYLGELAAGVRSADRRRVGDDLLQLRGAARSLSDNQQMIQDWMTAPVMRCPRCGGQERSAREWSCANCGLQMLYPDPGDGGSQRSATLSKEFKNVYDAYVNVVKGERTLSVLGAPLKELEKLLETYADLSEAEMTTDAGYSAALDSLAQSARDGLYGVKQMQDALENRKTRDLHDGWQLIFESALAINDQVPALRKAAGEHVPAASGYSEDAIYLQGDD